MNTLPIDSQNKLPAHRKASQEKIRGWLQSILKGGDNRVSVRGVKAGWGSMQIGCSFENPFLGVAGQKYTDGLGTHADSEILVESTVPMVKFSAVVGLDENPLTLLGDGVQVRLIFSIETQGKELWRSEELRVRAKADVNLVLPPDTKALLLKVRSVDGDMSRAHADWAAAEVEVTGGDRIKLGVPSYPAIPFSFTYDGKPSREVMKTWKRTCESRPGAKAGVTEHTVIWTDPKSALECRMELSEFAGYPALEWVIYFRNGGKADTAILENIQALDLDWKVRAKVTGNLEVHVYRSRGSLLKTWDFEYLDEKLLGAESMRMVAGGGRSSQNWLPFFNVDVGEKGIMTAIGWSGQWACDLQHSTAGILHMAAGMEKTHLKLHPGEEIRTPRILQLFWEDDRLAGHNLLRRFLLEHHTPRIDDKPITGPFTIAHWGGMETQSHLNRIAVYKRERLPMDYLWVDAGWYGLNSTYSPDEHQGDWGRHTGDWRVNPRAHPNGLKPIAQAARNAGMKFLLWVEPERAIRGTPLPQDHPDWFIERDQLLLNLGNPVALQGAIELLSGLITEHEVDLYREDFNIDPLEYWRQNDAPDRQGMTEIRFNEGLYAFWDALLARHPGLIIDNCASGGRRIDLETISRSVALWQSDIQCYPDFDPMASQVHHMGLNYWLPLHGTGTWNALAEDEMAATYRVRSTMGPAFQFSNFTKESLPIRDDYPWDWFRRMCADYLRARPFFVGDYYPLTEPFICDSRFWAVYQMDRPDLGGGIILAFRRKDASWDKETFKLHGLDEKADYEVEDADTGAKKMRSGSALLQGLDITLPHAASSALFFYTKKK